LSTGFKEVEVQSVRVHVPSGQHLVILQEKDGGRYLPIWIGIYEANAIALALSQVVTERPITHDLIVIMLQELGAEVKRVEIVSVDSDVFFAKLFLEIAREIKEIDSRPSDALAIAVRLGTKVFVSKEVLDNAGLSSETEEGKMEYGSSIFKEFINNLDLPDLDNPIL
jgi:bifunctional DNase/RNase